MEQGPFLFPLTNFTDHQDLPTQRLRQQYTRIANQFPLYRKVRPDSNALFRALAFFFMENLLVKQRSSEYEEEKQYLFTKVYQTDLTMVEERQLSKQLHKYLDKGVLLKTFSKMFQNLEKITQNKSAQDVSEALAAQFNDHSNNLQTVSSLLFRCLVLTAIKKVKNQSYQFSLACDEKDPAIVLLVTQHLQESITYFKNLVEIKLGSKVNFSQLFYWNNHYSLIYSRGHSQQSMAPAVSYLKDFRKTINVVSPQKSKFNGLIFTPISIKQESNQSKSPCSNNRKTSVAIQTDKAFTLKPMEQRTQNINYPKQFKDFYKRKDSFQSSIRNSFRQQSSWKQKSYSDSSKSKTSQHISQFKQPLPFYTHFKQPISKNTIRPGLTNYYKLNRGLVSPPRRQSILIKNRVPWENDIRERSAGSSHSSKGKFQSRTRNWQLNYPMLSPPHKYIGRY